jgi:hypothetical protein
VPHPFVILRKKGNRLSRVVLYVQSTKTITGTIEAERVYTIRPSLPLNAELEPRYEYRLPEDQEKAVEIVMSAASKYDVEVEVVDLGRENILHRVIEEEREKVKILPTLMVDPGRRLEGELTEENVELFLSRIARERQKTYL